MTHTATAHVIAHHDMTIALAEEAGHADSPEDILSALEEVAARLYKLDPAAGTSLREFTNRYIEARLMYWL